MLRLLVSAGLALLFAATAGAGYCDNAGDLDRNDPRAYCSERALRNELIVGQLCLLLTEQAKPTQMSVGKVAVNCAVRAIESKSDQELRKYLQRQIVPTILGPNNEFFITDRHHLSSALFTAALDFKHPMKHRVLYACINDDFRNLTKPGEFWATMQATGNVYLKNEYGQPVQPEQIPAGLKQLHDDPFRTLSKWVRNSYGYIKCGKQGTENLPQCQRSKTPFFLELIWANFLRNELPPLQDASGPPFIHPLLPNYIYEANFQSQLGTLVKYLKQALQLATDAEQAGHLPGFNESPDKLVPSIVKIDSHGCDRIDEA